MTPTRTDMSRSGDDVRGQRAAGRAVGPADRDPSRLATWIAVAVTALYVIVTAVSPYLYGKFLAPVLVVGGLAMLLSVRRIPITGIGWTLALVTLGVFGILFGNLNNNPGANQVLSVFVLEPLVLGVFFSCAATLPRWRGSLVTILDAATILVGCVGVAMFVASATGRSVPVWITGETHIAVDLAGVARTNYQGYGSLAFLAPYAFTRLLTAQGKLPWRLYIAAIAALSGVLFSGRNIYFVAVPLAVGASMLAARMASRRQGSSGRSLAPIALVLGAFSFVGFLIFSSVLQISPKQFLSQMIDQITLQDESGTRSGQSSALIQSWLDSPLIGHGAGAVLPGVVRNVERPWVFEQTYEALLFHFGLLGLLALSAWTAWTARHLVTSRLVMPNSSSIALLAGLLGAVLSSTVNPYITKLDGMWMVFIPFGLAAAYASRHEYREEHT